MILYLRATYTPTRIYVQVEGSFISACSSNNDAEYYTHTHTHTHTHKAAPTDPEVLHPSDNGAPMDPEVLHLRSTIKKAFGDDFGLGHVACLVANKQTLT